jgi:NAD(P)-dependent dehydrogenase (short-subunit alcohol dehydrogenase family)
LNQAVALVTNALAFAGPPAVEVLVQAGFQVVAHDTAFASAEARSSYQAANPQVVAVPDQTPADVVQAASAVGGRLDVLVSNDAYRPIHGPVEQAEIADLQATLDHLVVFPFGIARAAIPLLKAQAKARVVFISSNRTRLPLRGGSIPDIARAGVNAFIKSLSIELAPHGIPVNAIAPNFLYSEMYYPKARFADHPEGRAYLEQTVPVGRLAEPQEIGELIHYLATMQGNFMTGAIIDFSGGWPVARSPTT